MAWLATLSSLIQLEMRLRIKELLRRFTSKLVIRALPVLQKLVFSDEITRSLRGPDNWAEKCKI